MATSRHLLRVQAMTCLYQHFLLNKDIKEVLTEYLNTNEIDQFLYTITIDAVKYKDQYIKMIEMNLRDDWNFERLGYVERSILLLAVCELDLEITPKPVVINEAIKIAKQYCDEDAYKLINGILDKL